MLNALSYLDWIAVIFFIACWYGYAFLPNFQGESYNLSKVVHRYRLQWIKNLIKRTNRASDVAIVSNLIRTATIFSSFCLIMMLACLVFIVNNGMMNKASLLNEANLILLTKITLLAVVIIFAFFKFTWVIRQSNYVLVLIAAAPVNKEKTDIIEDLKRQTRYVNKTATMLSNIARHFNAGMRSLYFLTAVLAWYANAVIFILVTIFVVAVLYRREFMSKTLIILS